MRRRRKGIYRELTRHDTASSEQNVLRGKVAAESRATDRQIWTDTTCIEGHITGVGENILFPAASNQARRRRDGPAMRKRGSTANPL